MFMRKKLSLSGQKESKFKLWPFRRSNAARHKKRDLFASRSYAPQGWPPSKVLPAIILIVVSFIVVGAAIPIVITVGKRADLDAALCQKGMAPEVHVAFIVDVTDGLSAACFRAFQNEFKNRLDRLQVYERISLYVIGQVGPYPTARGVCLFSRCRPRDGSNADPAIENPKKIKDKFEKEFLSPLQKAVVGIDPDQRAHRSPILETLLTLGRTPEFAGAKKREVYYFGNLLENSERINQYQRGWEDFDGLAKHSLRVLDVENLLTRTDVTVFLTPDPKQTTQHAEWWRAYFKLTNAASYTVKRL